MANTLNLNQLFEQTFGYPVSQSQYYGLPNNSTNPTQFTGLLSPNTGLGLDAVKALSGTASSLGLPGTNVVGGIASGIDLARDISGILKPNVNVNPLSPISNTANLLGFAGVPYADQVSNALAIANLLPQMKGTLGVLGNGVSNLGSGISNILGIANKSNLLPSSGGVIDLGNGVSNLGSGTSNILGIGNTNSSLSNSSILNSTGNSFTSGGTDSMRGVLNALPVASALGTTAASVASGLLPSTLPTLTSALSTAGQVSLAGGVSALVPTLGIPSAIAGIASIPLSIGLGIKGIKNSIDQKKVDAITNNNQQIINQVLNLPYLASGKFGGVNFNVPEGQAIAKQNLQGTKDALLKFRDDAFLYNKQEKFSSPNVQDVTYTQTNALIKGIDDLITLTNQKQKAIDLGIHPDTITNPETAYKEFIKNPQYAQVTLNEQMDRIQQGLAKGIPLQELQGNINLANEIFGNIQQNNILKSQTQSDLLKRDVEAARKSNDLNRAFMSAQTRFSNLQSEANNILQHYGGKNKLGELEFRHPITGQLDYDIAGQYQQLEKEITLAQKEFESIAKEKQNSDRVNSLISGQTNSNSVLFGGNSIFNNGTTILVSK